MTDFDYEILAAVESYGDHGATLDDLKQSHFPGYTIWYNLYDLSTPVPMVCNGISITYENQTCLYAKKENLTKLGPGEMYVSRYFLTHQGRSLLNNWKRYNQKLRQQRRRESFGFALFGAVAGYAIGLIANEIPRLICLISRWLE